jgi:hypothetical protein
MKFKPKMPVRRAVQVQEDIKPDISSASVRGRPSLRARGRGGAARGGARAAASTIAAGPFGGSRSNCESTYWRLVY